MTEANTILYELSSDEVVIPRPQYEALMAAKDELVHWWREYYDGRCECRECNRRFDILAALRSAGIETGEGE